MTFVGKQKPTFDISIVMQYAVAVTDYQGFVSSGGTMKLKHVGTITKL